MIVVRDPEFTEVSVFGIGRIVPQGSRSKIFWSLIGIRREPPYPPNAVFWAGRVDLPAGSGSDRCSVGMPHPVRDDEAGGR